MEGSNRGSIEQASAIPYRHSGGQVEFCLITSVKRGRWGVPKGIIDPGETAEETALKEAQEEAGLHGRIVSDLVGRYEYRKWGSDLVVSVYLMEVSHATEQWLEDEIRQRCWCTAEEAYELIDRPDLVDIFEFAVTQIAHKPQ